MLSRLFCIFVVAGAVLAENATSHDVLAEYFRALVESWK